MDNSSHFTKEWEDLEFSDSNILTVLLEKTELCKGLLERLLHIEIESLEKPEYEAEEKDCLYDMIFGYRINIVEKGTKKIIQVQIHGDESDDLMIKARFFQRFIDYKTRYSTGTSRDFHESYIIFLSRYDRIGLGLPVYTRKMIFEECPEFKYNDGTHLIIYNSGAYEKEKDPEIKAILKYMCFSIPCNEFTKKLEDEVFKLKCNLGLKKAYLSFYNLICEEREYRLRDININIAKDMLEEGKFTKEEIAEILEVEPRDLDNFMKEIGEDMMKLGKNSKEEKFQLVDK